MKERLKREGLLLPETEAEERAFDEKFGTEGPDLPEDLRDPSFLFELPKRIQRKREKGWKKPPNAVIVDRTSKWGNPFKLDADAIYINAKHRRTILDPWVWLCLGGKDEAASMEKLLRLYRSIVQNAMEPGEYHIEINSFDDILHWANHFKALDLEELRGKDLVCFCKEGEPCHADVLIELANSNA